MAAPDLAALKSYLGVTSASDTEITAALAAETAAQAAVCRVGDYPADLTEALKRRVARNLKMRSNVLGLADGEMGSVRIGSTDPEVRRLEAPYRRRVVG